MKDIIINQLKEIERLHDAKILFAVESGSRAWGLSSPDSDYDVRFVYLHHPDWYLSIDEKRDVIELPVNGALDMSGWDLRKALKLFRKSNPPLMEWLLSDQAYVERYRWREEMLSARSRVFSPKASLHHYLSMASNNYKSYAQDQHASIKKMINVLRPVFACLWIQKYDASPPVSFQRLVEELLPEMPELKAEIKMLLDMKMARGTVVHDVKMSALQEFVRKELHQLSEYANSYNKPPELLDPAPLLDELFRKYLKLVWGEWVL